MGYGHLRPAAALAGFLGVEVQQIDRPPLGDQIDFNFWERTRKVYEPLTRLSQIPFVGPALQGILHAVTDIPFPWPERDLSGPTQGTKWMERAAEEGVGRALARKLTAGTPLLTTFYAGAILAELHGAKNLHCLVTDAEINRVWAPPRPRESGIVYFAPSERAARRLRSYGVSPGNIKRTGYPLPDELVGRDRAALDRNYQARLRRLRGEGEPPLVVFAIGGAGAQVPVARQLVPGMKRQIEAGRLRLALVAGRRPEVAKALNEAVRDAGLEGRAVEVLEAADVFEYIRKFNALLARADVLWTKPSELTFFAGLGLPLVAATPVGVHEEWNLRWAADRGAALPEHDPRFAGEWLLEWLEDGVLAGAAKAGYERLPQMGLYEIADVFR